MIVLAVEFRERGDFAVKRERGENGVLDGGSVNDGETAWHPKANGANVRVRRCAGIIGGTAAKHFALRQELCVNFKTDDRFEFHDGYNSIIPHFL